MADGPDFDDFELDDDEDDEGTDSRPSAPMVRATIAAGGLTLNRWSPRLMRAGPARAILRTVAAQGARLADLAVEDAEDGREVVVTPVANHPLDADARATLVRWARVTGYRRIWLPGEVVELPGEVPAEASAEVRCPTCLAEWEDDTPEFWHGVDANGYFPGFCPVCAGSLPEWRVAEPAGFAPSGGAEEGVARAFEARA